jgi:hypothetical protein
MLSQGAQYSRYDASLAVTRPVNHTCSQSSEDFPAIFERLADSLGEYAGQGYVYAISKSVLLLTV